MGIQTGLAYHTERRRQRGKGPDESSITETRAADVVETEEIAEILQDGVQDQAQDTASA